MATYDPEAVRSRPAAPEVSPVDALLDGENKTNNNAFDDVEEMTEDIEESGDFGKEQNQKSSTNSEDFRPFEVPPIESVDEGADRANRIGALIATVVLVCLAIFWKKRKKAGS